MHARGLHLHSMVVHAVLAFTVVAAAAFALAAAGVEVGQFDRRVWRFLLSVSLVVVLLTGSLATVTGILERRHLYVTWHRTHRLKLWLGFTMVTLAALAVGALAGVVPGGPPAVLAALAGLVPAAAAQSALGLKMTLGRQSLAGTSYRPDALQDERVDIVAAAAAELGKPADVIDVMGEGRQP